MDRSEVKLQISEKNIVISHIQNEILVSTSCTTPRILLNFFLIRLILILLLQILSFLCRELWRVSDVLKNVYLCNIQYFVSVSSSCFALFLVLPWLIPLFENSNFCNLGYVWRANFSLTS